MTGIPELQHLPGVYDPFSSLSHFVGAGAFLFLGLFLLRRAGGDRTRFNCLAVYVFTGVLLLCVSGAYHMADRGGPARPVLARADHSAIFLLIAGTFTPTHGILFRGWLRWRFLAAVWTAAALGVLLKTVFFDDVPEWLGLTLYLMLSWLGGVSMLLLARRYGFRVIRPLLVGGVAYTAGGVADFLRWPVLVPGVVQAHEVFHVAVLAGVFSHWRFIWDIAAGKVPSRRAVPHRVPAGQLAEQPFRSEAA